MAMPLTPLMVFSPLADTVSLSSWPLAEYTLMRFPASVFT